MRHALSPALFALVIVSSIEASPFWLLFLPGLFLFFRSGARCLLEGDVLADALSIGKVDAPVFERLDTLVSQAIAENKRSQQTVRLIRSSASRSWSWAMRCCVRGVVGKWEAARMCE